MEQREHCKLVLDVQSVSLTKFDALLGRLREQGVAFTTLAQERATEADWLARFTELDNATRRGDVGAPRTVEEMPERLAFLGVDLHSLFLAKVGTRYVGYTLLNREGADPATLRQGWTGVHPDFRRQGIATALKVLGIRYAQEHGFRYIVTEPRTTNAASIGLSVRVGFQRPAEAQTGRNTAKG